MGKIVGAIVVNTDRCKGCSLCVVACPKSVIELAGKKVNVHGYPYVEAIRPDAERRGAQGRDPPSPTPRCSYFLKRQDCLKIQDFLKIQEIRQLGVFCSLNPFFGQPVLWRAQPVLLWVEGRFLTRDASSAGRSADPLLRVLLPGNLYWWRGASFGSSA